MTERRPPDDPDDKPDDDENPEFDRFEKLTKKLLKAKPVTPERERAPDDDVEGT